MLRFDVTTNDWVIFAPSRALRPDDFKRQSSTNPKETIASTSSKCPFCPGNEHLTPQEIYAVRDNGASNWQVRVVPNKFPALRIEEPHQRVEQGRLFRSMGGCGAHEVIIDSPDHNCPLALQSSEQVLTILRTLHSRYNDLMRDHRFQTIVIFKNHGLAAGTSLTHPHFQLIATPVASRMIRQRLAVATQFFDGTGECLYSVQLQEELAAKTRILAENEHFVALLPYASHSPFETWIFPRFRQSSFHWVDPALLRSLAHLLRLVLQKLHFGLDNPAFNLTIETAPRGDEDSECFLWHIQIVPRLTTPAGFELGSGMSINTTLPEEAAEFLRAVDIPPSVL
jgi:UDPglucose--hexose-1-phosphate uridylyltransferase